MSPARFAEQSVQASVATMTKARSIIISSGNCDGVCESRPDLQGL